MLAENFQPHVFIAGDGAPPFAVLYGDVGHERFQVLILRT
jgi:hypothetical protein